VIAPGSPAGRTIGGFVPVAARQAVAAVCAV
jgi:hypothetical protein